MLPMWPTAPGSTLQIPLGLVVHRTRFLGQVHVNAGRTIRHVVRGDVELGVVLLAMSTAAL